MATLTGAMCSTSQCELRSTFPNLRVTNVIHIVTYYTLPRIESPTSSWMMRSQRSRRRDQGLWCGRFHANLVNMLQTIVQLKRVLIDCSTILLFVVLFRLHCQERKGCEANCRANVTVCRRHMSAHDRQFVIGLVNRVYQNIVYFMCHRPWHWTAQ